MLHCVPYFVSPDTACLADAVVGWEMTPQRNTSQRLGEGVSGDTLQDDEKMEYDETHTTDSLRIDRPMSKQILPAARVVYDAATLAPRAIFFNKEIMHLFGMSPLTYAVRLAKQMELRLWAPVGAGQRALKEVR